MGIHLRRLGIGRDGRSRSKGDSAPPAHVTFRRVAVIVAWARVPAGTSLADLLPALRASNLVFGVVPTENETTLGGEPAIELVSEHAIRGHPRRPPFVMRNRYSVRRGWLYELGVMGTLGEAEERRWERVASTFEFVELPPDGVGQ